MLIRKKSSPKSQPQINNIEITPDTLSSRSGILLYNRYLEKLGFYKFIQDVFGSLPQGANGMQPLEFYKQLMAYFFDGSCMHISYFEILKNMPALASFLNIPEDKLASSHQIKRFFKKYVNKLYIQHKFRFILRQLFIWRLKQDKPSIIEIGIDTMVLDNNDALKREGCKPTYKKKLGFQPLQITWNHIIIDAIFRDGDKHSNHGKDVVKSLRKIVNLIRAEYKIDVPIIVKMDSGFFADANFSYMEDKLDVLYICSGKRYANIVNHINKLEQSKLHEYQAGKNIWNYAEFGCRLDSWKKFRRFIYTQYENADDIQLYVNFGKPDQIICTNIGVNPKLTKQLISAGGISYLTAEGIIEAGHKRGAEELVHRSYKELLVKEQLPFKKFGMNQAYYYFSVISHTLFESYKRDVSFDIISVVSYPSTFRRKLVDFAGKVVSHANTVTLKVTKYIYDSLNIKELWERCHNPVMIL
ncbi:MAG: IS1380 family transposase [Candidatus Aureabacteria bacterium]|nr:IS1380 family transposase [Candidatus Auribacterota bacterium]